MRISDWSSDVCSSDLLVSVELTTMTLATIFNFPWEERAKLTRWSDVTTASPETGIVESFEQRREELIECAMYFKGLWDQRIDQRSEEHTSELQSLMRISYAVLCLKKKT